MKIGQLFVQATPDMGYSHKTRLAETQELVELCEELEYHGVSFGENHFSNYGYSPNPILLAVGLCRHTKKLNVATGVAVLPFWQPLRFAEDAATADMLLEGRIELGLGWGYQQLEFNGLNIPYEERQERFKEALEIIMQAWTKDELDHQGRHYTVPRKIGVMPKPYTKPHPRIFVAVNKVDSIYYVASTDFKAFGVGAAVAGVAQRNHEIYLEERRRLGKTGDYFVRAMNRQVYVVDSSKPEKIEEVRQDLMRRGIAQWRLAEALRRGNVDYHAGEVRPQPLEGEPTPAALVEQVIFGSPEMVLKEMYHLRDNLGIQEVNLWTDYAGLDFASTRRSIELFGKEVLPALRADKETNKTTCDDRIATQA